MTNFEMILEILRVVVWPLTLLIALILFRHEVRSVLVRLRRGKILGQELELSEEAQKFDRQVQAARKAEPSRLLIDPAKDKSLQLAEIEEAGERAKRLIAEVSQDKLMAFVRIWIDIEQELRALVAVSGWLQEVSRHNPRQHVALLARKKVITQETAESIVAFSVVRNRIIHGKLVRGLRDRDLVALIDSGIKLLDLLRSIPRAKYRVHAVVPFFSDESATVPVKDASAVVLQSTAPDGTHNYGVYPTTKYYEPGQEPSWEWNLRKVWGPAWYRDVETGQVKKAWDSAGEFVGRPLETIE